MMEPAVLGEQFQEDRHSREDELSIESLETGKQRRSPADSRSRSLDDDSEKQTPNDDLLQLGLMSPLSPGVRSVSGYIENGGLLSPSGRLQSTSKSTASSTTSLCTDDSYNASMHNVMGYRERLPTRDLDRLIVSDDVESSEPCVSAELEVRVDKPEKIMSTMDTYITFRVLTKTRRSDFMQNEYEVRRRYNDFVWLRQRLEQEYPMLLIPPLPEKHSVYSLDRFDPAFVKTRCYLLHLFLQGLVTIPKLNRHEDLRLFLTADLQAWIMYRKSEHSIQRVTEALFNFAATRLLNSPDSEFQSFSSQCHELGQTVVAVEKLASKLNRTEQQAAQETASLQAAIGHWGETDSAPKLRRAASAVALALDTNSAAIDSVADRFDVDMALYWRHWTLYADTAKAVLRRRDSLQYEQVSAREAMRRKSSEKETLGPDSPKLGKAVLLADETRHKSLQCDANLRDANAELRRDWIRWQKLKNDELLCTLRSFARLRLDMHRKCLNAWATALDAIDAAENGKDMAE